MSRQGIVHTIKNMPLRGQLMTAGHQALIPETALWRADNCTFDLDGTLQKRPGIKYWNLRDLYMPSPNTGTEKYSFLETFNTSTNWTASAQQTGIFVTFGGSSFQVAATAKAANEIQTFDYNVTPSEAITLQESSCKFTVQVQTATANTAVVNGVDTFSIKIGHADLTSGISLCFYNDGLYYILAAAGGVPSKIANSEAIVNGGLHTVEMRFIEGVHAKLYVDNVLVETIASGFIVAPVIGGSKLVRFQAGQYVGKPSYAIYISNFAYKNGGTSTPFIPQEIKALTSFEFQDDSGYTKRTIAVAASNGLYVDTDYTRVFKHLQPLAYPETYFAKFRNKLLVINHNNLVSDVWSYNGGYELVNNEDAPNIRFGSEYKSRFWGAGNTQHPLRLYFSASRNENSWFDPSVDADETVDEVLNAGYIDIPPRSGNEITAIYGDHLGTCIVFTDRGVWRVAGNGPEDFALQGSVSSSEGCVGPEAVCAVGNDLWFVSEAGVYSLQQTDQFGDMLTQTVSAPIMNLWSSSKNTLLRLNTTYLRRASLAYVPRLGQIFLAVPTSTTGVLSNLYVYSMVTQGWVGPWILNAQNMQRINIGYPLTTTVAFGGTTGYVRTVHGGSYTDEDTGDYSAVIELPYLTGRSIQDPNINVQAYSKRFRRVRLYFQAQGAYNFTLGLFVDGRLKHTLVGNQNRTRAYPYVDGTFQVDVPTKGLVTDAEAILPVEIPLDVRGNNLSMTITSPDDASHIILQGYEVDFILGDKLQGAF